MKSLESGVWSLESEQLLHSKPDSAALLISKTKTAMAVVIAAR